AIPVHANDAADPQTIIHLVLFDRLDVVGLAQRNIALVVRPDPADASGVIEAFLFLRDELCLGDHNAHRWVWPFEEELRCRELENTIACDDIEETVRRETGAIGNIEGDRRGEVHHLVGYPVAIAIHHRPHLVLSRAHENDRTLWGNRQRARIRNDSIETNLEAGGDLDVGQNSP